MNSKTKHYFEKTMLPHLSASYHFALSIMGHQQDAEDAVQEAYIRAYRAIEQFSGDNSASWLLKIVRNTCLTQFGKSKGSKVVSIDSKVLKHKIQRHQIEQNDENFSPETRAIALSEMSEESRRIHQAISELSLEYREVIVLREFQDFSYQEISDVTLLPIGTVMSRLSRARRDLRKILSLSFKEAKKHEL